MNIDASGWGNFPHHNASVQQWKKCTPPPNSIARGLGRSYGDAALADFLIDMRRQDKILSWDAEKGRIRTQAGLSLDNLLRFTVPRGFFVPVSPGTRYVTVGGMTAADVHGKNHHQKGSFCEHVSELEIMLGNGDLILCNREKNADLFKATCGGMGLSGVITKVAFSLMPISSGKMNVRTMQTANLEETLQLFQEHAHAPYSVAWIDALSQGEKLGRGVLQIGEHHPEGERRPPMKPRFSVPENFPDCMLNSFSMRLFNACYYHRAQQNTAKLCDLVSFFYPLDGVRHWNRLYGKQGFQQHQFVLPLNSETTILKNILKRISNSQRGSFLAVLKLLGKENDNLLSFPMAGYTLAVDFKRDARLPALLNALDEEVTAAGGRIYLAKDASQSESCFKRGYPRWREFLQVRQKYGADKIFNSLLSKRLGI